MPTTDVRSADNQALRRYLRDLVSLTALPALWGGADRLHVAESLADGLVKVVSPDFVYVRLKGQRGGDTIEVVRTGQGPDAPERERAIIGALGPCLPQDMADAAVFFLPHPFADGPLQAAVTPV